MSGEVIVMRFQHYGHIDFKQSLFGGLRFVHSPDVHYSCEISTTETSARIIPANWTMFIFYLRKIIARTTVTTV